MFTATEPVEAEDGWICCAYPATERHTRGSFKVFFERQKVGLARSVCHWQPFISHQCTPINITQTLATVMQVLASDGCQQAGAAS